MDLDDEQEPCCFCCSSLLSEPFIQCSTCGETEAGRKVTICLHCFAKGVEFGNHKNDHSYYVVKNNFPVFEKSWTAVEELALLKAVSDCGYGNWADIANKVRTKNQQECEQHYNWSYVENPSPELPEFPEANVTRFPAPVVYKLCEDPPRPAEGSLMTTEMAGYMPGRGDFMTEHDNFMELDLRSLYFDTEEDDPLETDLKFAVVDVYQRCLRERWRRKRIIRKYGLINMRKNSGIRQKYDKTIGHIMDGLRVFCQCLEPEQYEMYLESAHYEQELKSQIRNLQEYRRERLTRLRHIKMYRLLKQSREKDRYERHLYGDVLTHLKRESQVPNWMGYYRREWLRQLRHIKMYRLLKQSREKDRYERHLYGEVLTNLKDETACQNWLQRQAALESLGKGMTAALPNAPRRAAPPLDIVGLPGFDKLNSKEKDLCSHIRLVPSAYLDFKTLLVNEYQKHGFIKLAQARLLIKIDVNKTRKIFDFLVSEGVVFKDPIQT